MTDKEHAARALENAETAAQFEIKDSVLREALLLNIEQEVRIVRTENERLC